MMIPEQSKIEAVSAPYILKYFYITPLILFIIILALIYSNLFGLAAAVIGAGPFALYVVYQEFVDKPYVEICEEGIYYDRRIMEDDEENCIFPYIEVATSLVNVGNATADDCHVRVSVDEFEYFTRWTSEVYGPSLDLHPGWEREIILFRLVPSPDALQELFERVESQDVCTIDANPFPAIEWGLTDERLTIDVDEYEMWIQRPMNHKIEEHVMETEDISRDEISQYLGEPILAAEEDGEIHPEDNDLCLKVASNNWSQFVELEPADFQSAFEEADWFDRPPEGSDEYELLDEIGWIPDQTDATT